MGVIRSVLTEEEVVQRLRDACERRKGQKAFAEMIRSHPATISLMVRGKQPISPLVASALGLQLAWINLKENN